MIALRQSSNALRRGSTEWLRNSDEARIVTYLRRGANEEIVVAINFSNRAFFGSVEVANGQVFSEITPDIGRPLPPDAPSPKAGRRSTTNALPTLSLDAWGYRIFRRSFK
jgi:glycosidase